MHTVTLEKTSAGLGFSLEGGKGSLLGDKPLTVNRIFKGVVCVCVFVFSPAGGGSGQALTKLLGTFGPHSSPTTLCPSRVRQSTQGLSSASSTFSPRLGTAPFPFSFAGSC